MNEARTGKKPPTPEAISPASANGGGSLIDAISHDVMADLRTQAAKDGEEQGRQAPRKWYFLGLGGLFSGITGGMGKRRAEKAFDEMAPGVEASVKEIGRELMADYQKRYGLSDEEMKQYAPQITKVITEALRDDVQESIRQKKPNATLQGLAKGDPEVKKQFKQEIDSAIQREVGGQVMRNRFVHTLHEISHLPEAVLVRLTQNLDISNFGALLAMFAGNPQGANVNEPGSPANTPRNPNSPTTTLVKS